MEKDATRSLALMVLIMKEIHAYRNEDGTYRVEGIAYTMYDGELREVLIKIPRATIDYKPFTQEEDGTLYTIEI